MVEFVHDVPGSVPDADHDDADGKLGRLDYGLDGWFLLVDLSVGYDD